MELRSSDEKGFKSPQHKSPWIKRKIARAKSDLNWERRTLDGRKAVVDLPLAPVDCRKPMSDTELTYYSVESFMMDEGEASAAQEGHICVGGEHTSEQHNKELNLNQLFLRDPPHASPLNHTTNDATLKSIRGNLDTINIDDHTLETLLSSMENSADDNGHKFEHWRAAVRNMVAGARKLASPSTTQLAEAIMEDRTKALTEAQMSLNNERIRLSKTKKAILDRSKADSTIATETEALEKETDSLKLKLFMKEKSLGARIQDLRAADQEHVYQEEKLEHLREAVFEKEEIVSKVESTLSCERDHLKNILHRNVNHVNHCNYA